MKPMQMIQYPRSSKIWILLLALSVLSSARGLTAGEVPMNTEMLKALATRYTAAWCSQDAASVAAFFAKDGTLFVNGEPSEGREAITAMAQGFMTAFPDMVLLMDGLDFQPEQATYHWTFIGTNTGPGGTGNPVHFSGYEEWTFDDDGLIIRSLGHFDNDEYQNQLKNGVSASRP